MEAPGVKLATIAIEDLRWCPIQLRPVRKETTEYYQLRDDIRDNGIRKPLLVRPCRIVGRPPYEGVDGQHRYEIALDLRLSHVPVAIQDISDSELLVTQVTVNTLGVETRPVELAKRLWTIINVDRSCTIAEIAYKLKWSIPKVQRILRLLNLAPAAKAALSAGSLSLAAACHLAKLPVDQQLKLLNLSAQIPNSEFIDELARLARLHREGIKDARTQRNQSGMIDIRPRYRRIREIEEELDSLTNCASVLASEGLATPEAMKVWQLCLRWATQVDPASAEVRQKRLANMIGKETNRDL